jgi:hypothetical protein
MKKYVLFWWEDHEQRGGIHDIFNSYDTTEEAKSQIIPNDYEEWELVDRDTWENIKL